MIKIGKKLIYDLYFFSFKEREREREINVKRCEERNELCEIAIQPLTDNYTNRVTLS